MVMYIVHALFLHIKAVIPFASLAWGTVSSLTNVLCWYIMAEDHPHLYKHDVDQIFDNWNMAAIVSLLNFLDQKLVC